MALGGEPYPAAALFRSADFQVRTPTSVSSSDSSTNKYSRRHREPQTAGNAPMAQWRTDVHDTDRLIPVFVHCVIPSRRESRRLVGDDRGNVDSSVQANSFSGGKDFPLRYRAAERFFGVPSVV
jgi:hypothetical protein